MEQIRFKKNDDFNIEQICTCGQLFRFKKTKNSFVLFETDEKIEVFEEFDEIIINTNNVKKHIKYFDFDTNYGKIKQKLARFNDFLKISITFGAGIRILKQDLCETIISFIISANNNIPRIQKTIEQICENFGKRIDDYYAFPTLEELAKISVEDFKKFGAGYRAKYLVDTIDILTHTDFLQSVKTLNTEEARKKLIELKGVGPKVADCILLFALNKKDVFPVDTWVKKVYVQNFGGNEKDDTRKASKFFVNTFKELSGFAQQYMFSYKRNIENKKEKI